MKEKALTLLFLIKGTSILLAMKKRGFGAGRWNGVGGKVEPEETIEQAMVREAQEEISVTPTDYKKMAELHFEEYVGGQKALMHVHVFTGEKWLGTPTESDEMVPKWFKFNSIPYDDMWSDDPYWLPLVINGKKITASFKLDEFDKILSHDIRDVEEL